MVSCKLTMIQQSWMVRRKFTHPFICQVPACVADLTKGAVVNEIDVVSNLMICVILEGIETITIL
jgi:hypothetical protein